MSADGALSTWRRLRPLVPSGSRIVLGIGGLSVAAGFAEALVLVLVVQMAVFAAGDTTEAVNLPVIGDVDLTAGGVLAIAAVAAVVSLVGHALTARLIASACAGTIRAARRHALRSYSAASWGRQERDREGALQQTVTSLAQQTAVLTYQTSQVVAGVGALGAMFVAAVVVNVVATVAMVGFGGLLFVVLRPLMRATRRRARRYVATNNDFAEEISAWTRLSMDLRVFGVESVELSRLEDRNDLTARRYFESRFATRLGSTLYKDAALCLLVAAVAAVQGTGSSDLGEIGAVVLLVVRSLSYAAGVQSARQDMNEQTPNLDAFLERTDSLAEAREEWGDRTVASILPLDLRGVGYRYHDGRTGLSSVDLRVEPGEILGIIGPSGSGKSTLAQLLLRLRVPTDGTISAGGADHREIDPSCWNRKVALVSQQPVLFAGTVADNIRYFREGIDDDAVRAAAASAHVLEDIERLPDGLDTVLGARGAGLSGGQAQRVALARAIVGRPELLVLDEPTSALDSRSEELVQGTIETLKRSLTIVVVAHRVSTLEACDRVAVVRDGAIAFLGPLDDAVRAAGFAGPSDLDGGGDAGQPGG